jgi:16S rRNA (cytosine967-C5)-methyltransferase
MNASSNKSNKHSPPKLNTRALAALILTQVITQNRSLTQVLPQYKKNCQEQRDAAFLQTLCYGTLRFLPRIEFMLRALLKKPFKAKDQDIFYLLCVGIYQLLDLNTPPHATVSESVEATRQLKKPWASGVVNAVLQNYLRQASSLSAKFQEDREAESLHPAWLLDRFAQAWPTHVNEIIHSNNHQAPLMLRINRLRSTPEDYLQQLENNGISAKKIPGTPAGIVLDSPRDVAELPGFNDGYLSVQDGAAQLAAQLLDLAPGLRVLDACAAPGGKTADILETEPALSEVVSLDISAERTRSIRETLSRLHLTATVKTGDALNPNTWWDNILFDRILLDAPCSATGVIRRHPDIKFLRQPEDIANFSERQLALLKALWPLLKPNGILVYATCSILPEENELVLEQFLQHSDATLLPLHPTWGMSLKMGWQFLPGQNNSDGFYYVRLLKAKK